LTVSFNCFIVLALAPRSLHITACANETIRIACDANELILHAEARFLNFTYDG